MRYLILIVFLLFGCTNDSPYFAKNKYGELNGTKHYQNIVNISFTFKPSEDCIYFIEAWSNPHRAPNELENQWFYDFTLMKPDVMILDVNNNVYRIDILEIKGSSFERSTIFIEENKGFN